MLVCSVRWAWWPARSRRPRPGRRPRPACPTPSCRSATRRSPVRRAAGPATRTRARRASTRSARPRTTTSPAPRRSRAAIAPRRPRSTSAGVESKNLACSGARTYTQTPGSGDFKPGLDFYSDSAGRVGQARALQQYAQHAPRADGRRADRREQLRLRERRPDLRHELAHVADVVEELLPRRRERGEHVHAGVRRAAAGGGQRRVRERRQAMRNAGVRGPATTGCSPRRTPRRSRAAAASATRRAASRARRSAAAASGTATPTGPTRRWSPRSTASCRQAAPRTASQVFDAQDALAGHRLCENTVGLLEETGIPNWTSPGAADRSEWVSQIRTVTTLVPPYQLQEDLHPSYWGQLALRNCLRQAYRQATAAATLHQRGRDGRHRAEHARSAKPARARWRPGRACPGSPPRGSRRSGRPRRRA